MNHHLMSIGVSTAISSSQGSFSVGCSFMGLTFDVVYVSWVSVKPNVLRVCLHTHCSSSGWPPVSESKRANTKARSPCWVSWQSVSNLLCPVLFKLPFPSFLGVRYNGTSCSQTKLYRTVQKTKQNRDGKATQLLRQTLWFPHTAEKDQSLNHWD